MTPIGPPQRIVIAAGEWRVIGEQVPCLDGAWEWSTWAELADRPPEPNESLYPVVGGLHLRDPWPTMEHLFTVIDWPRAVWPGR